MDRAPRDNEQAPDSFEPWELEVASREVAAFLATRRESVDLDRDDLTQQCLLHWWQQRGRHDPSRGASTKTLMKKVVRAKLVDIERTSKASKRGGSSNDLSLDAGLFDEAPAVAETISDPDPAGDPEEAAARGELRGQINSVARGLTHRQRQIVEGVLGGYKVSEVSRRLGISRSTLYDDLERIQQVFRDEGLHEFLD